MVTLAGKERAKKALGFADYYDLMDMQLPDGWTGPTPKVVIRMNSANILAFVNAIIEPPLTREEMNGLTKEEQKAAMALFAEATKQFEAAGITEEKKTG